MSEVTQEAGNITLQPTARCQTLDGEQWRNGLEITESGTQHLKKFICLKDSSLIFMKEIVRGIWGQKQAAGSQQLLLGC